ncbi:hypothetical protein, partial [Paenibacillus popilliae]|uniref:hypothetical protein n=1 Tax=Paenibacillus popilliae TaxID=78057 RepID=UPI001F38476A
SVAHGGFSLCEWGGENFHSTRIRPWALCFLFQEGVALHFTIRLMNNLSISLVRIPRGFHVSFTFAPAMKKNIYRVN